MCRNRIGFSFPKFSQKKNWRKYYIVSKIISSK